jgi:uncharacterized protein YecE (DUF72 family)
MARIHIGLSGYSYKPWQGPDRFYPPSLKSAEFLRYYAGRYDTVELDGIWYRMPSEQAVRSWMGLTPSHFIFAPKANRLITHIHRLKPDALSAVRLMLDRLAPLVESSRLGPILLQLPPNLRRDDERLQNFVSQLPNTIRWAMEFRHESWNVNEVESILRTHGIAWAAVETDDTPAQHRETANFHYARLRRSDYTDAQLGEWADWFKAERNGTKDCFVYCKHEDQGSPWVWADLLLKLTAR